LAIGLTLTLVIFLLQKISGAYINPATTIAMVSNGKLGTNDLIPYIIAQVFGGLAALEIYKKWKL
jgi:aquaporin Z